MAEKPVNVTPEDQKLQHANEKHNELARILAFLEETVKSRVDLNGFERQRIYIAAGETAHLSPPPFARSVVMVGLSSWTLTTMGTLSFSVTNPTAFIPILTPGAPVDVKNPTSADAQVTVVYLGENPSQLMASLFATTSTLTTQLTGTVTAQLTGSLAPLTANNPKLVLSVPYGDFTASGTVTKDMAQVFSRNARFRTFVFANTLDQTVTDAKVLPYDSAITATTGIGGDSFSANGGVGNTFANYYGSDNNPTLKFETDSAQAQLTMGSTAPTSGSFDIYVIEVI